MGDTENNLRDIYKSAIAAMKKEVHRLNQCLEYQQLSQKLEKRQQKINSLKNNLKFFPYTHNLPPTPSPTPTNTQTLKKKIINLQEKINKIKSGQYNHQETFEHKLQKLDPSLYLTVTKLEKSKKINSTLKQQLNDLTEERKRLNLTYSKITTALRKEMNLDSKLESLEALERKIKEKEISIRFNSRMIEQIKANVAEISPEVQIILQKSKEFEQDRLENARIKEDLVTEIQKTCQEIDRKLKNPEKITFAAANLYCRQEIQQIQLEIAEKSRVFKDLEHQKLMLQTKYSESLKIKTSNIPKINKKSLSNRNTHSSLATDRASTQAGGSMTPGEFSMRQSKYVMNLLSKEKECTITKDVFRALEFFAPGESLASKIIAFNRSDCTQSLRSFR